VSRIQEEVRSFRKSSHEERTSDALKGLTPLLHTLAEDLGIRFYACSVLERAVQNLSVAHQKYAEKIAVPANLEESMKMVDNFGITIIAVENIKLRLAYLLSMKEDLMNLASIV
jgi:hypothetical protein